MQILRKITSEPGCRFFFIVGTGRCGTTVLAQAMNAHSRICVPHELQIIFEYSHNGERLAEVFAARKNLGYRAEDYIRLIEKRCPHRFDEYYDYRGFFHKLHYPVHSLRWLLTTLYSDIARSKGKIIFGEQSPWYGQNIELLNSLFPRARFIHLVRDGRDVAISFARTPWWHKDVNVNLERWEREINKIDRDGVRILRARMHTIRYEDLISSPEKVIKELCRFLGIAFESTMLDPAQHIDYGRFRRFDMAKVSSPAYQNWQRERSPAFFSESVYHWKTNQEFTFAPLTQPVLDTLAQFGYEAG